MRAPPTFVVCLGLPVAVLLWTLPLISRVQAAAPEGLHVANVEIGFGGAYKIGYWTPVWVTLAGGKQPARVSVELAVPDGDGVETRFLQSRGETTVLPAGDSLRLLRYVKPGRVRGGLTVRLYHEGSLVASREFAAGRIPPPLPSNRELFLTYGPSIGIRDALPRRSKTAALGPLACRVDVAQELPDDWRGYEGVNVLALTTKRFDKLAELSERQLEAIRQWVGMGGRLILCSGEGGEQAFGENGRLAMFAPGRFVNVVRLREVPALETFTSATQPLSSGAGVAPTISMTRFADPQGRVLLEDEDTVGRLPMIVRRTLGMGLVVFVAFDLDEPPFSQWGGRPRLMSTILQDITGLDELGRGDQQIGKVAHVGFTDVVGQLRSALDKFSGFSMVAVSWVAGLIIVYILLIGPGDFFFLRDFVRRMQWTWVTFPLLVLVFMGIAVALNARLKGHRLSINQVDLVDVDVAGGLVRGTTWAHVYSPQTRVYDFRLRPLHEQLLGESPTLLLSWQGLPGTGLGGMQTNVSSAAFSAPYAIAQTGRATTEIVGAPIQITSTKCLLGRWSGTTKETGQGQLSAESDNLLHGDIVNPLPVELFDCVVMFENWAYRLDRTEGRLAPGQATRIDRERPFNLEWRLMRRTVRDKSDVTIPWDRSSQDVRRIMEMVMFYGAARGPSYTQLTHRYQGYLDVSDHLSSGCAVLWGRAEERATDLILDDGATPSHYDRHWTIYRVLFPVRQSAVDDRPSVTQNSTPKPAAVPDRMSTERAALTEASPRPGTAT